MRTPRADWVPLPNTTSCAPNTTKPRRSGAGERELLRRSKKFQARQGEATGKAGTLPAARVATAALEKVPPFPDWSPPGTRRGRTATGAGGKAFSPAGRAQRPSWPKTGNARSPNAKSPAEAGLEDRGAGAPTVELLKPELRRSTRRTGSRSRHHTRRCGHRRSQPWGSCPRCCGCRPATGRCRQRPA